MPDMRAGSLLTLLAFAAALLLGACRSGPVEMADRDGSPAPRAAVDAPDRGEDVRQNDDRVILRVAASKGGRLGIPWVNGQFRPASSFTRSVTLGPGENTVTLNFRMPFNRYANGRLFFVAEPGVLYHAKAEPVGNRVRFWIEDSRTKKVVSRGVRPGDDIGADVE
jgi:hypothetical protein